MPLPPDPPPAGRPIEADPDRRAEMPPPRGGRIFQGPSRGRPRMGKFALGLSGVGEFLKG